MRFEGKTAIVTGGASGIGRATAQRLAREGARVWIGDIDLVRGGAVAAESGDRIAFLPTDVTREDHIAALVDAATADGGRLDLMVNNAGAGGAPERIDELAIEGWDRTMALLLRSVMLGTKHATRVMAGRGGGAIVNTASIAALAAGNAPSAYSIAKAGVLHLTKVAAADLARHAIRVNAVCPGFIVTDIFTASFDVTDQKARAQAFIEQLAAGAQPVQRAGRPEDVAAAIAFLGSDDAAFVNGTSLVVDGGMTIGERHAWDATMPGFMDAMKAMAGGGAGGGGGGEPGNKAGGGAGD